MGDEIVFEFENVVKEKYFCEDSEMKYSEAMWTPLWIELSLIVCKRACDECTCLFEKDF